MSVSLTRIFSTLSAFSVLASFAGPAQSATPTELFLSEYIEGSSNNKALEIYNGTGSTIDLAAGSYNIQMFFNGSGTAGLTVNLAGAVASGDVFVLAHSSADASILAQADQTNGAGFFNGDDAIVLRKGTTVIDSFGQIGVDPGSEWVGGGADDTFQRKAAVCAGDTNATDAFDAAIEWNLFATNTFTGLGSHTVSCTAVFAEPRINEFSASTAGTDVEYVEIIGAASTDYSTYTVLEIEGDATSQGIVDHVIALGSTDANGLYLANLAANDLENGTLSLLLVKNFTGALGNDLDSNNDGTFDTTPWDAIVDSVAVNDGGAGDLTYGAPALGPNYDGLSVFAPGGASRIPDGADTDAASDWVRNDFDLAGIDGFAGTPVVGEAYNTPGAANEAYVPPTDACGFPSIRIHDIQGNGLASALDGSPASIEGIVVGDFQAGVAGTHGNLGGFFVQEEDADADADPLTSEGIFVFQGAATVDVSPGDHVRVTGTVDEFNGLTELTALSFVEVCTPAAGLPTITEVSLPVAAATDFEPFEGMYVTLPQALVIAEYFNFDRFNEIVLTSTRHTTPTAEFEPGPDAIAAAQDFLLDQITLDDGRSAQNPDPAIHPNGAEFDLGNLFRGGDTLQNVTGVMDYAFGLYRIQPTQGADYTSVNLRTAQPDDVGGNLKIASFNVLNYFNGDGLGGGFPTSRGANNPEEFNRQRDKIIAAMTVIDADVVGLMEIENDGYGPNSAIQDLVNGLNAATAPGTYAVLDPGVAVIGTDEIAVGLIYKPATVTPQGASAILDSSVDPAFIDTLNRPALAQTFAGNSSGGVFTVAVNHLKSKGSDCNSVGDPDIGDGSGNCNLVRTAAAIALAEWLASDPTGSNDDDRLIIGDLNSYDKEDPIDALTAAGYTDLAFIFGGEHAYSYVFEGQTGYLDYALASPILFDQVSGATEWHINADEPDLIDYNTDFKAPAQDAIYAPDPYRASDHDPVIAGLALLHYDFSGFFQPLKDLPALNTVKAGSSVPLKFSLDGDQGLGFIADGYPLSQAMDCGFTTPGAAAPTLTTGGSSLAYDAAADQYVYVWQTEAAWKGSCRQLVILLDDGSYHRANFEFK